MGKTFNTGTLVNGVTVLSNGNVGIGTTNPTSRLHIINNTDGFVGRFTGGAASTVTAGIFANSTTGFASIGVQSNHQFRLFTNDADRLTIATDGKVGIGTTSPNFTLDVNTSSSNSVFEATTSFTHTSGYLDHSTFLAPNMTGGALSVSFGKSASNYNTGKFVFNYAGENSTSNSIGLGFYNADNLLVVRANGNIGVGTTNPTNRFQVYSSQNYGTINDQACFEGGVGGGAATNPAYYGGIRFSGNNYDWGAIRTIQANPAASWYNRLAFFSMNGNGGALSERMCIDNQGYIGINTSSPGFRLDVSSGVPDVLRVINTGSATGNNPTAQFLNTHGNHSWGICAEFRVGNSGGTDSSAIMFSQGYNSNTFSIGFGFDDTTYFRVKRDHGPYGGGWGVTLLTIDRSGNYSFAGSNVSDRRNKKDISYVVDSQIDTILKLKPATFVKKSPGIDEYSEYTHTGFIAQDVLEEDIPNLVHGTDENGYALDYDGVLALAVKAIQELEARIKILENK